MRDIRQHVPCEQITFRRMGITGKDERLDPLGLIGAQLRQHLIRIADDRRAATRTRAPDTRPQIILDEAVAAGGVAQLGLSLDTDALRVERFVADRLALLRIQLREQPIGVGAAPRLTAPMTACRLAGSAGSMSVIDLMPATMLAPLEALY